MNYNNQILANLWDKNATTLAKNLQENYGSGFEIESYTFPPKYKPEDLFVGAKNCIKL